MKATLTRTFSVLTLLFSVQAIAGTAECVLPAPDGEDVPPSPPSLIGVIASATIGEISVKTNDGDVRVSYVKETQLFTVYGGIVFAREIKAGQHVFVWYRGCKEMPKPEAAVIQFCSTEAETCLE